MTTVRVVVTGATGQVAYALLPRIAAGEMFGADTEIDLRLSDIPPMIDKAKGVVMELEDGAYPLLAGVAASSDVARFWSSRVSAVQRSSGTVSPAACRAMRQFVLQGLPMTTTRTFFDAC